MVGARVVGVVFVPVLYWVVELVVGGGGGRGGPAEAGEIRSGVMAGWRRGMRPDGLSVAVDAG